IDRGDPEREADRGVGGRAATLAEDLPLIVEADDVLDGEEEGLVLEFGDQRQFVFDLFSDQRWRTIGPAPAHDGCGELAQMRNLRFALRHQLRTAGKSDG